MLPAATLPRSGIAGNIPADKAVRRRQEAAQDCLRISSPDKMPSPPAKMGRHSVKPNVYGTLLYQSTKFVDSETLCLGGIFCHSE